MLYLVIYDITSNKLRNKIAEVLKNYGLDRIQYSAFIGRLQRFKLNSLIEELKREITRFKWDEEEKVRNIQIYPIPEISKKARIEINYTNDKLIITKGEEIIRRDKIEVV